MRTVVWFHSATEQERSCLGGKSISLGEMISAGLPVPSGFSVTTQAFRLARDGSASMPAIGERLAGLDLADPADVSARAAVVREIITGWPVPLAGPAEIQGSYQPPRQLTATSGVPVAVRSSATTEGSP